MKRIILFLLTLSFMGSAYSQELYKDMNAPMHERIMDLQKSPKSVEPATLFGDFYKL